MFYKLMNNDIVADVLRKVNFVRYLPRAQRWVGTDPQSAHGVIGSDGNTIYRLEGKSQTYPEALTSVKVVEISEEEYIALAQQSARQRKENEELRSEIATLKSQMQEQNQLLLQILSKL